MNRGPERKNRTGMPNQHPEPECCREEGQAQAPQGPQAERPAGSVHRDRHGPQAEDASRLSNPASKELAAGGDDVISSEPNMKATAIGKVVGSLPGSKSVARVEEETQNLRDPALSRRSNYGNQAGKSAQRQEEPVDGGTGVGSLRSREEREARGLPPNEGSDVTTQPTKATSAVRTTDQSWRTSLRAIATKAAQDPQHRFGGLYRLLTVDNLRVCFQALRKDAAPGVDDVTWKEYQENLQEHLQDLVRRLRHKSYHARLVRRKYIPKGQGKLRPLGIPTLEDKLVQYAVTQILSAIYEADFLPCSYGYRPARSAHDAVRVMALAFEIEDRVDDVLECLGTRQIAIFRDMADEERRHIACLGGKQQLGCGLAHLSDAAGRRLKLHRIDGLNRVDDDEGWLEARDLFENPLETGFSEQIKRRRADRQSLAARLDLMLRFFARAVQHGTDRARHVGGRLQQQRGLADAGLAAEQHERSRHDAAAEYAIEFADACRQSWKLLDFDVRVQTRC